MVNAIILAGDNKSSPVKDVANKALIRIKDKYMVEYVIDSLRSAKCVDRIVIVGPEILKNAVGDKVDAVLQSGETIVQNIKIGIDFFNDGEYVILCTSDIPMVSGEAIEDFVNQCMGKNIDVGYPIIEKSLNDIKYPDVKRTYVRLKDGTYTGGNIIFANPEALRRCYSIADELVKNRKNAIKMGRLFGFVILLKLVTGMLRIKSVEKRAKKLLGINAKAIKTSYPEIGNDVDKIDDVDFVNKYMDIGA